MADGRGLPPRCGALAEAASLFANRQLKRALAEIVSFLTGIQASANIFLSARKPMVAGPQRA